MAKSTASNSDTRAERQPTPEGEWVEAIPPRTRKGVWEDRIKLLQANPGRPMVFRGVSSSTVSHIRATYPEITATNRDVRKVTDAGSGKEQERADLYLVFQPESPVDDEEAETYDEFAEEPV